MSIVTSLSERVVLEDSPKQPPDFFHLVNRIIPDDQRVLSVPPETLAIDAIALMRRHNFSQLPVKQGDSVLGVFSYRAYSIEVANSAGKKISIDKLTVEECLDHEDTGYAALTEEFQKILRMLDTNDSVVVSGPENLIAILTPMDVLRYLYVDWS